MNVEVFLIGLGLSLGGAAWVTFSVRVLTGRTRLRRLPPAPHRIPLGLTGGSSLVAAGVGMSAFAIGGQEGTPLTTTIGGIALGTALVLFLVSMAWLGLGIIVGDRILPRVLRRQLAEEGRLHEPVTTGEER